MGIVVAYQDLTHKQCSGDRPRCEACVERDVECRYDTVAEETHFQAAKRKYTELERQMNDFKSVYHALQVRPKGDAQAIFRRIRRGDDVDVIARHIEFGDLLIQVALEPETRYRYKFPLVPVMPAHLLGPWNPYLDSMIYEWAATADDQGHSPTTSQDDKHSLSLTSAETVAPYLKPYHAAEVINHQLNSVEPSRWTTVSSDNMLMRSLLRAYLLQEHCWDTCLQKDYFLEDMAKMRRGFCSPLLVNAVLAASCVRLSPSPPKGVVLFRLALTGHRTAINPSRTVPSFGTPRHWAIVFLQKPRGCGSSNTTARA